MGGIRDLGRQLSVKPEGGSPKPRLSCGLCWRRRDGNDRARNSGRRGGGLADLRVCRLAGVRPGTEDDGLNMRGLAIWTLFDKLNTQPLPESAEPL